MDKTLSPKYIFSFWWPLALTWFFMAIEGSIVAVIIARLPEAKINLAAFGVAFSIALIFEAPVMMMLAASTALVRDKQSFLKLRRFAYAIGLASTILLVAFIVSPGYDFFTLKLMQLEESVAAFTRLALILMLPWPIAICYRRFYQGVMITGNQTRLVAFGTFFRLFVCLGSALILAQFDYFPGAAVGAGGLSFGVIVEALITRYFARDSVKYVCRREKVKTDRALSYSKIWSFYYPLMLTCLIALSSQPMVTFFLGRAPFALESLAVIPVTNGLIIIFFCVAISFQEVVISLNGDNGEHLPEIRNFSGYMAVAMLLVASLFSFTSLGTFWFGDVTSLPVELVSFAVAAFAIISIKAPLSVYLVLGRAILLHAKRPAPITRATLVEIVIIAGTLWALIEFTSIPGLFSAYIALVLGRLLATIYLARPVLEVVRKYGRPVEAQELESSTTERIAAGCS